MMAIIQYSPVAQQDMDEIFEYISQTLLNPIAAQNTINGILDSIAELKTLSDIGTKVFLPDRTDSGYRSIRFKNYLAFYRKEEDTVFIDRILYARRDYLNILFPNSQK